jgi:CelD/BcsL family acetyltransferase involved in cellulose biosynthesis
MRADVQIVAWDRHAPSCLIAKWEEGLRSANNFHAIVQTPEWIAYRWSPTGQALLAVLRDSVSAAPVAVTPLVCNEFPLAFSAGRKAFTKKIPAYHLNGNIPLFPDSVDAYQALINRVFDSSDVQCMYIWSVSKDSIFYDVLTDARHLRHKLVTYNPYHRTNSYYFIKMPPSYEEYCNIFKSKALYNMKRELRLLEKRGPLDLIKVTRQDQVAAFLADAYKIAKNSHQQRLLDLNVDEPRDRHELLAAMARRGALRCYLLRCGEHTTAYVIGSQFNGVFYLHETAYDKGWGRLSPGKSLLQLVLKECFEAETPRIFHFSGGEAPYKKYFSNNKEDKETLLILRDRLANRMVVTAHRLFCSAVSSLRHASGRR